MGNVLGEIDIEERRSIEAALRPSEGQLELILDGLPALVSFMTPDGRLERANRRYLDYYGARIQELRELGVLHSLHPQDRRQVRAIHENSLESGKPYEAQARCLGADGVYRWFEFRAFPLRDGEGRIVLWHLLQTDIHEQKEAEFLLNGEKKLLEMVATGKTTSSILDALCHLVEDTATGCYCSVVLIDPTGVRLEHGAAPSLPGSFVSSITGRAVNAESGPCAMAAYLNQQVIAPDLASESRWEAESWCSMALAHGIRSCWSMPIASAAGAVLGAFAIYFDDPRSPTPQMQSLIDQLTHIASIALERERAQRSLTQALSELQRSERLVEGKNRLLEMLAGHVPLDDILVDLCRLVEATMAGSFCSTMLVDHGRNTFHRATAASLSAAFIAAVESMPLAPGAGPCAMAASHRDQVVVSDLGSDPRWKNEVWYQLAMKAGLKSCWSTPVVSTAGQVLAVFAVYYRDLKIPSPLEEDFIRQFAHVASIAIERIQSEEALESSRSELARVARVMSLGALTASIAHEVNQPLFAVTTNASTCMRMLGGEAPNLEGAREMARRIIRDGNHASEVIARLRAMFVKRDPTTESVDLNEATKEVIALSSGELQRSKVVVRTDLAENLPTVMGDRVQLQQVILNLCLNAADAMNEIEERPRQMVISTGREADMACLTVQDAGVGFEPETAEKLFDAFFTTKRGGMGIGLSVSRSIIESHHGRLWAARNDGPGATFAFAIPINPQSVPEAPAMMRVTSGPELRNA
jgi:PAS domain S-box-containing protein